MDASQYKDYVLVLLFIKYADKYAGMPYAPITIPPGATFKDMVALKPDIGDQINKKIIAPAPLGPPPREARTRITRPQSPETPLGASSIFLDFHRSQDESLARLAFATEARQFRQCGMYQPPPLRRSVFDDKKVLLIDPHQCTRDVRASPAHQLF